MLLPLHMFWVTALRSLPQSFIYNLARWPAHGPGPNLLASDEPSGDGLPECLTDEVPLNCAGVDQIKNRSQRSGKPEALRGLYFVLGQVCVVKHEDARDLAIAPEIRRNRHMKLRGIQIRQIEKAECRVVAIHAFDFLVPVSRPQRPENKVGPISCGKQGEAVNPSVLPNPVPCLYMIGVRVFSESGRLGLLGCEESLLLLSNIEELPGSFAVRLCHNTILQLY